MKIIASLLSLCFLLTLLGCSRLSQPEQQAGMATVEGDYFALQAGVTNQDAVKQQLGPPDFVTTNKAGQQVWTYHHQGTIVRTERRGQFFSLLLINTVSNHRNYQQMHYVHTLRITFDTDNIVLASEVDESVFS